MLIYSIFENFSNVNIVQFTLMKVYIIQYIVGIY